MKNTCTGSDRLHDIRRPFPDIGTGQGFYYLLLLICKHTLLSLLLMTQKASHKDKKVSYKDKRAALPHSSDPKLGDRIW